MITEKAPHFQVACSPCPPKHISDYQSSPQAEQGLSPEGIGRTQLIPSSITHASEGGSSAPPPWPLDPDLWNQLLYPREIPLVLVSGTHHLSIKCVNQMQPSESGAVPSKWLC